MSTHYLILSPRVEAQDLSVHTDLLEDLGLDYPELLDLTLQNWQHFSDTTDQDETLEALLEGYLREQQLAYRLRNYQEQQYVVRALVEILQNVYEGLMGQLGPLLRAYGLSVEIRLTRTLHKDAMVKITTGESGV